MPARKPARPALDVRGLMGVEELLRLPESAKRDPAIDPVLQAGPVELRTLARKWFERLRACGGEVRELMHDGYPVACLQDAPFAYVNTFKGHVNVGFFQGAALKDPAGLLEGGGKRMRHVKLFSGREPDEVALGELVEAAYWDMKARLAGE